LYAFLIYPIPATCLSNLILLVLVAVVITKISLWRGVLLEKLIVTHLLKKFLDLYGTRVHKTPLLIHILNQLNNNNNNNKLSLCFLTEHHAMKTYWGSGGIAPFIL
jgi:hypothetical protein